MKFIGFGLIASLLGGSSMAAVGNSEGRKEEDCRFKGSEPSEIISRLEIRNGYLGFSNGGHLNQAYLRGD